MSLNNADPQETPAGVSELHLALSRTAHPPWMWGRRNRMMRKILSFYWNKISRVVIRRHSYASALNGAEEEEAGWLEMVQSI